MSVPMQHQPAETTPLQKLERACQLLSWLPDVCESLDTTPVTRAHVPGELVQTADIYHANTAYELIGDVYEELAKQDRMNRPSPWPKPHRY